MKVSNQKESDASLGTKVVQVTDVSASVTKTRAAARFNASKNLEDNVPYTHRRGTIRSILSNLHQLTDLSAIKESLKGVVGVLRVGKIVNKDLKDQHSSFLSKGNTKNDVTLMMEEMQAKIEKLQRDATFLKQQNKMSIQHAKQLEPPKESSSDPVNISAPPKTPAKKIFIRSRL